MASGFKIPKRKYASNNSVNFVNNQSGAANQQQISQIRNTMGQGTPDQPLSQSSALYPTLSADPYSTDSAYTEQLGLSNSKLNDALAGSMNDENALASAYGVTYQRDGGGNIANTSIADNVDLTNPFSKAALLKQSYDRSKRSTTNSYAGMGQFGSGAYENAQKQNIFNNEQGRDSIIKSFAQGIQGILERRKAAQQLSAEEKLAAERALLERQLAARDVATPLITTGDMQSNWGNPPTSNQDVVNYLKDNFIHTGTGPTLKQAIRRRKK